MFGVKEMKLALGKVQPPQMLRLDVAHSDLAKLTEQLQKLTALQVGVSQ
jgi:hypothetical protein